MAAMREWSKMTEFEYRNAVFLVECAEDCVQRAIESGQTTAEIDRATAKLEDAKSSLNALLEKATADERRLVTAALVEQYADEMGT